jgi:hypothetical protein
MRWYRHASGSGRDVGRKEGETSQGGGPSFSLGEPGNSEGLQIGLWRNIGARYPVSAKEGWPPLAMGITSPPAHYPHNPEPETRNQFSPTLHLHNFEL